MSSTSAHEYIEPTVGTTQLPSVEILAGRGFVTGKSGSGKSNTTSVVAEELLDNGFDLLVVDTEGEYYGLAEEYDLLHVGLGDRCDRQATPADATDLASLALEGNTSIILDVSDYLDGEEARELIAAVVEELYHQENDAQKPFLLIIEEMQEYLPQTGGSSELATLLERVAKRGRKRGLGMMGVSQRPSSVDKDFITQCDYIVWHRLTWQNDLDVVRKVLDSEKADAVQDLGVGEAFLVRDWDEEVERVQFKRKRTHDAGATPGLDSYDLDGEAAGAGEVTSGASTRGGADGGTAETASGESTASGTEGSATAGTTGTSTDETVADGASSGDTGADATTAAETRVTDGRTRTGPTRQPTVLHPPEVPESPDTEHGIVAGMIELAELLFYVIRLGVYRLRLLLGDFRHPSDDRR